MGTVFAACVVIVSAGVIWFHILRPILVDFGVIGMAENSANTVNHSQVVMSPPVLPIPPDKPADKADRQTDTAVSADPRTCPALRLDKTKSELIRVLVYNGWNVGEIRAAVKGDNTAIGVEVQAARSGAEGTEDDLNPDVHITPIAGRRTRKEYYPDDPELAYQPPD